MNGALIIDKPEGYTSHDVVARLRGILQTKKIGHTGTLDPFATGVLVMLVGKATRLAKYLDKDAKAYEAVLRFGFETDTGDRTGEQKGKSKKVIVSKEGIEKVLPDFQGEIEQTPPMYSAKKVKGKKLYELARQGIEIERKPVAVKIHKLELVQDKMGNPHSEIRIHVMCSAGTYIRTLAEDIGKKVGVGCHLAELRRTRAGKFNIAQAISLEELEEKVKANELDEILISMNDSVSHLPETKPGEDALKRVANGMKIDASFSDDSVLEVRLTDADQNLVAIGIYNANEKKIQPRIVFLN